MTRVLDKTGKLQWHGFMPNRLPSIRVELVPEEGLPSNSVLAVFERELTEDDGGPLLIYRVTKEVK